MSNAPVFVRQATPLDARFLGQIHFEALNELGVGGQITQKALSEQWSQAITSSHDTRYMIFSAVEDGVVVGFLALAPTDPDNTDPESPRIEEIIALEVHSDYRRKGHASRLLAAAATHAQAIQADYLTTWIPSEAQPRTRFFSEAGFAPAGSRTTVEGPEGDITLHAWAAALESSEE